MEVAEEEAAQPLGVQPRHLKKRNLRNKALSISFDEKDLTDYVTGFHKRKKKRRKEAELQTQEVLRRKRIEARKKRKLEREFALYGAPPTDTDAVPDEDDEEPEDDEEKEPIPSISGTTMYDNGNVKVTVTTSEISPEEELPSERLNPVEKPQAGGELERKKQKITVIKKKPLKKVAKKKPQKKTPKKRDKRKANTKKAKR